jgi:hypothetical protein
MKLSQHVARTGLAAGLAAGLAITAATAVAFTVPATAQAAPKPHKGAVTPMWAGCGHPAPPNYDSTVGHTKGNNVNLRRGSDTACGSNGQAQSGDRLDYYCFTHGTGTLTWTYVKDLTTGKFGWILDSLLPDNGSQVWCGF